MAGRVHDLEFQSAKPEFLAIGEQMVELHAGARHVGRIEQIAEHFLHFADVRADADLRAGLGLQVGCGREMVGMGVGLEDPFDRQPVCVGGLQHGLGGFVRGLPRLVVEIHHRIDDGRLFRRRIAHQVADGVGRLVEKGPDRRLHGFRSLVLLT